MYPRVRACAMLAAALYSCTAAVALAQALQEPATAPASAPGLLRVVKHPANRQFHPDQPSPHSYYGDIIAYPESAPGAPHPPHPPHTAEPDDSLATLLQLLPFPTHAALAVATAVKWAVANVSLVIVGGMMLVGLCTLTPFCHISFNKFEELEQLPEGYYRGLERAARMLRGALHHYEHQHRPL